MDLVESTGHAKFAAEDYLRLQEKGIRTCRDGVRWHLIEKQPYEYDFSSVLPMLRAANRTNMQVIWDVCHYGWPDDLDLFGPNFVHRFCEFARHLAMVVAEECDGPCYFSPVNELSFFAWAIGEVGCFYPWQTGRGDEAKAQLVSANVKAVQAIRSVLPDARFVQVDPVINIVTRPGAPLEDRKRAANHLSAMYNGWDMVAGRKAPELAGTEDCLDIIGANYYVHNQWVFGGSFIDRTDTQYRPLHKILKEVYSRYGRPLFIAETGIEDGRRAEWFSYVCDEVVAALYDGVPVEGICLYPIVNHPGWDDDRHCHNGLWDYCNESGHREIYNSLAAELEKQSARMDRVLRELAHNEHCASVSV